MFPHSSLRGLSEGFIFCRPFNNPCGTVKFRAKGAVKTNPSRGDSLHTNAYQSFFIAAKRTTSQAGSCSKSTPVPACRNRLQKWKQGWIIKQTSIFAVPASGQQASQAGCAIGMVTTLWYTPPAQASQGNRGDRFGNYSCFSFVFLLADLCSGRGDKLSSQRAGLWWFCALTYACLGLLSGWAGKKTILQHL